MSTKSLKNQVTTRKDPPFNVFLRLLSSLQAIHHYIPNMWYFSNPKTANEILHLSGDPNLPHFT